MKSDERILGESGFVEQVLSAANERMDRHYQLQARGFTCEMLKDVIYSIGRCKIQVAAISLMCYWAVRKLGLTNTEFAKRLGAAVSYAVSRGEQIAKERNYNLVS